ncbi:MAG: PQQ-binding-like beta-propeller repeat protein [Candidatus Latescibacterota bacterium]|nr:PQQ-binding-like beta-propeller repeat protein [Candidatus Latescibacterota bacterium]
MERTIGKGAAKGVCPPIRWSETENIVWKVPIPGRGRSTPIVWEDRIYITTAIPTYVNSASPDRRGAITPSGVVKYDVIALDRLTGDVVWRRTAAREKPHEGTHKEGTWASHSPIVDGTRLFVFFGSRGLFCYGLKGELLWTTDFGDQRIRNGFGEGSSLSL